MTTRFGKLLLASAVLAGTVMVSDALAQSQAKPLGMYTRADSNGDGKISLAEFDAFHANQLALFDGNQDGTVTLAEIDAFFAGHLNGPGAQLARQRLTDLRAADINGDGVISAEEFKAVGDADFRAADTNHDGFIEANEVKL